MNKKEYDRQRYQKRKLAMRNEYHNNARHCQMRSRVSRMRRRGARHNVVETFVIADYEAVFDRFKNKCFNCGSEDRDLQVDHHMPQHLGNSLTHANAVILCDACNGKKARQMPSDFYDAATLARLEDVLSNSEATA